MNKTLIILAAGIGSRFSGGIKQLESVDDCDHIIIDYSIHDAIAAGFTKIVFIIRHDIEKDFREVIGNRIEKVCAAHNVEVAYAFQELSDIPDFIGKEKSILFHCKTDRQIKSCMLIHIAPLSSLFW